MVFPLSVIETLYEMPYIGQRNDIGEYMSFGNVSSPLSMEALGRAVGNMSYYLRRNRCPVVRCEGGLDALLYIKNIVF